MIECLNKIKDTLKTDAKLKHLHVVFDALIELIHENNLEHQSLISSHFSAIRHCLRFYLGKNALSESVTPFITASHASPSETKPFREGSALNSLHDDIELEKKRVQEQQYLDTLSNEQNENALKKFLSDCWAKCIREKRLSKKFFLSYAWPKRFDDPNDESHVTNYLAKLTEHFIQMGMQVFIDQFHSGAGKLLGKFMGKINEVVLAENDVYEIDHVLVVSSRTLQDKLSNPQSGCSCEHANMRERIAKEKSYRFVIPILLNKRNYLPNDFKQLAALSFCETPYLENLKELCGIVHSFGKEFDDFCDERVMAHGLGLDVYIAAGLKEKYCSSEDANIHYMLYQDSVPVSESFINLAIIKETEHQEKERHLSDTNKNFRDQRMLCFEDIHKPKELIPIAQLWETKKSAAITEESHVVIEGRAGIGKTTLVKYLANQWALPPVERKVGWLSEFDAVVWLPLRKLHAYTQSVDLATFIYNECFTTAYHQKLTPDMVKKYLLEKNIKLLYLLDGLDEVVELLTDKKSHHYALLQLLLKKECWIVTSRPHQRDNSQLGKFRRIENVGFLDDDIEKYIGRFFSNRKTLTTEQKDIKIRSLLALLKINTNIRSIAHIPINLELICTVWQEETLGTQAEVATMTMTMLYQKILVFLLRRYLLRLQEVNKSSSDEPADNIADFDDTDILEHEKCQPALGFLSELGWLAMQNQSLIIGPDIIRPLFKKHFPRGSRDKSALENLFTHLSILKRTGETKTSLLDQSYYFIHLTFQEFFAAQYIAEKIKVRDRPTYFFIRDTKYSPAYEIVWWFVAGLLRMSCNHDTKAATEHLEIFFNILESPPRELLDFNHFMLMLRCMDECRLMVSEKRKERFLGNLKRGLQLSYLPLRKLFDYSEDADSYRLSKDRLRAYAQLSPYILSTSTVTTFFSELLNNESYKTQANVLNFISEVFTSAPQFENTAKRLLESSQANLRKAALKYFEQHPSLTAAPPSLRTLLDDSSKEIRGEVIARFSRQPLLSCEEVSMIREKLEDPDEDVRKACAALLFSKKIYDSETQAHMGGRLEDPRSSVIIIAIQYFQNAKEIEPEIQLKIIGHLRYPSHDVRCAAIDFFIQLKNASPAEKKLISYFTHRVRLYKHTAEKAASKIGKHLFLHKTIPSLADLLQHTNDALSERAISYLKNHEEAITPEQLEFIRKRVIQYQFKESDGTSYGIVSRAAVNFFVRHPALAQDAAASIEAILGVHFSSRTSYLGSLDKVAIKFFSACDEVPPQTELKIALLLASCSTSDTRVGVANFFAKRKKFPSELVATFVYLLNAYEEENPPSSSVLTHIHAFLSHSNFFIREIMVQHLQHMKVIPEELFPVIESYLRHPNFALKKCAIEFFTCKKIFSPTLAATIQDLLTDKSYEVMAAALLFFIAHTRVTREVVELFQMSVSKLFDASIPLESHSLIQSLHFHHICYLHQSGEDITSVLTDEGKTFFEDNKHLLETNTPDKDASPILTHLMAALFQFLSYQTIIPVQILEAIERVTKLPDQKLCGTAVDALQRLESPPFSILIPLLSSTDINTQSAAMTYFTRIYYAKRVTAVHLAYAQLKQGSLIDLLCPFLSHTCPTLRKTAIQFITALPDVSHEIAEIISERLHDEDEKVGFEAIEFFLVQKAYIFLFFKREGESALVSERYFSRARQSKIYPGENLSLPDLVTFAQKLNTHKIGSVFFTLFCAKLLTSSTSIYPLDNLTLCVGTVGTICFDTETQMKTFTDGLRAYLSRLNMSYEEGDENFFEAVVHSPRRPSNPEPLTSPGQNMKRLGLHRENNSPENSPASFDVRPRSLSLEKK